MISFRCRHPDSYEWDSVAFDGDNEEMLGHLFARFLDEGGWEFLTSSEGVPMDWED